jgi:LEA14-like dessication related protein
MILFAAIGGLFALMGYFVYYASLDNPQLEQIEIELVGVEVNQVNSIENRAELETTFLVKNPSEKTFTVPLITFELFVDGKSIGKGQYSTEDIAMPGRAAFYPGSEIPLKTKFYLVLSDSIVQEYQDIINGGEMRFSVEGEITAQTAWSLIEKEFQSSM